MNDQCQTPDRSDVALVLGILDCAPAVADDEFASAFEGRFLATNLDHWDLWALICLYRHLERQEWVRSVVQTHLSGDAVEVGRGGSAGHPDIPQHGDVPGLEGWRYFFHGRGCCLTSKVDGTRIDVDFSDSGSADEIDPYFFSDFLRSLRDAEFPEQQLKLDAPFENAWQISIESLVVKGCLTKGHRFRLTELGFEIADVLAPIVQRISGGDESATVRAFLALHMDDPVLAKQFYRTGPLGSAIEGKAAEAIANRTVSLVSQVEDHKVNRSYAVEALAVLGGESARPTLNALLLKTPINGVVNTALEALENGNLELLHLDETIDFRLKEPAEMWARESKDGLPRGTFTVRLVRLYLEANPTSWTNRRRDLIKLLKRVGGAKVGEAALLLYILDVSEGFADLKRALASNVPIAIYETCAAIVLLNTGPTIALLSKALHAGNKRSEHAVACALRRVAHEERMVKRWFLQNDGIDAPASKEAQIGAKKIRTYSFEDIAHHNMQQSIDAAIDRLSKSYGRLLIENRDAIRTSETALIRPRDSVWQKIGRVFGGRTA